MIMIDGSMIPYHRIIKIECENKLVWEKNIKKEIRMSNSTLVKDYMTRDVITVTPETPNAEVIQLMKHTGHDGFPVKTDGEVIGMVTAFDLYSNHGCIWLKISCPLMWWWQPIPCLSMMLPG